MLFGREGKDTLDGGYGDDTLRGGDHADTYYFRKYNGSDTIFDQYGANLIIFEDIAPDDLSISYTGAYQQDLCFTVTSTGKTLTIFGYMHTAEYFRYQFEGESGYYTVKDSDGNLSFSKLKLKAVIRVEDTIVTGTSCMTIPEMITAADTVQQLLHSLRGIRWSLTWALPELH